MMRARVRWFVPVVLLGLIAAAAPAAESPVFQPAAREGGDLRFVEGIPVMTLRGDPADMGRQHAALVFESVRPIAGLTKQFLGSDAEARWAMAVGFSRLAVRRLTPHHREEMEAALQLIEDEPELQEAFLVINMLAELRWQEACSSLLVEPLRSATGGPLFGRNLDLPFLENLEPLSLVTIYRPTEGRAVAVVGYPATFGVVSGINESGLALAMHDSGPAGDGSPIFHPLGTPITFTFRRVLEECATVEEAVELLSEITHTTWANLAVSDRQGTAVIELTPRGTYVRRAEDHLLACTNHFRTDELSVGAACRRYGTLSTYWERNEPLTLADVAAALDAVNQGQRTFQTMVFEPAAARLHLAIGPPPTSALPLVSLDLEALFAHEPE